MSSPEDSVELKAEENVTYVMEFHPKNVLVFRWYFIEKTLQTFLALFSRSKMICQNHKGAQASLVEVWWLFLCKLETLLKPPPPLWSQASKALWIGDPLSSSSFLFWTPVSRLDQTVMEFASYTHQGCPQHSKSIFGKKVKLQMCSSREFITSSS